MGVAPAELGVQRGEERLGGGLAGRGGGVAERGGGEEEEIVGLKVTVRCGRRGWDGSRRGADSEVAAAEEDAIAG